MNPDPHVPWHRQVPDGIDHRLTAALNRRARWQRLKDVLQENPWLPLMFVFVALTLAGLAATVVTLLDR